MNTHIHRLQRSLTVVVLGMHRSGTSLTTRIISLCGARLGNNLLGPSGANRKGHWEHRAAVGINQKLLRRAGGAWDDPPSSVSPDFEVRQQMRQFLAQLHEGGQTAVWKDPRSVLTFPIWKSVMVNYLPVFVYRYPMSVAQSLQKRDGFSIAKGLSLWCEYNQRLLKIADREDEAYFVNFDRGRDHIEAVVRSMTEHSFLQYNSNALTFYDDTLRSSDKYEKIPSVRTKRIYNELITETFFNGK